VAQVVHSAEALDDLERVLEFLEEAVPDRVPAALNAILSALGALGDHPLLGRRIDRKYRELVISRGTTGYLALYRFEPGHDVVRIPRIRHQREAGYRD
jgi:plasmid stabilization system protein ParE